MHSSNSNANQTIESECGIRIRLAHKINNYLLYHSFKGVGIIRGIITKMLVPPPKSAIICPTNYGFSIIVDPLGDKGWAEKDIYYYGTYEPGTIDIMKKFLKPGDTFIDVGSNIGFMALSASKFVGSNGHVFAFEPEPDTFNLFKNNIKINSINNIHAFNLALGSTQSKTIIYSSNEKNKGESSLVKDQTKKNLKESIVSVDTLNDIILPTQILNIKMIKIDVQGWEYEVLKGADKILMKPTAPIICVEYSKLHPIQNGHLEDIYEYLLNINNYKIFKLEKGKGCPSKLIIINQKKDLPSHDNIFCFLPTHLNCQ